MAAKPSAWITNPTSRATKARLCRTTRIWSIRLPSAAGATRARAFDSPMMHSQIPASIRPAMNRAITKWPRYAPPSASRMTGASAPPRRIAMVRNATRHAMSVERSCGSSVSSADRAM